MLRSVILAIFLISSLGLAAADIDVVSAQQKYDQRREIADQSKQNYQDAETKLAAKQARYLRALQEEQQAERTLNDAKNNLSNINAEMTQIDQAIPQEQQKQNQLENTIKKLTDDLKGLKEDEAKLKNEIKETDNLIKNVDDKIAEEKKKPTPDPAVIKALEGEKKILTDKKNQTQNKLSVVVQSTNQKQSQLNQAKGNLNQSKQAVQNYKVRKENLKRMREELLIALPRYQQEYANAKAKAQTNHLANEVEDLKVERNLAKNQWDRDENKAREAYAYLQEVKQNYQNEYNRVVKLARDTGLRDGGQEGSERGAVDGSASGREKASEVGFLEGTREAQTRDRVRGYLEGRAQAVNLVEYKKFLDDGRAGGVQWANEKAQLEVFPQGYNLALERTLNTPVSGKNEVDLSKENVQPSQEPVAILSDKPKAIGSKPGPTFGLPTEPVYSVPLAPQAQFFVPAKNNKYYFAPCQGLASVNFVTPCKDSYESGYSDGMSNQYSLSFKAAFKSGFGEKIEGVYQNALAQVFPELKKQGLEKGVTEFGVLDGYAGRIEAARTEALQKGQDNFASLLSQSALLVFQSTELQDTSNDGLLTPQEKVGMGWTVDNLGGRATPSGSLKLALKSSEGFVKEVETTYLPSLAPGSRNILNKGLLNSVARVRAGAKLGMVAAVMTTGEQGLMLGSAKGEAHFPVEVVKMEFPAKIKIGEKGSANIVFKNMMKESLTAGLKVNVQIPSATIEVDKAQLELPTIESQGQVSVPVTMIPSVKSGGVATVFEIETGEVGGLAQTLQDFEQVVPIERSASMVILTGAGQPWTQTKMKVTAGTRIQLPTLVRFEAKEWKSGPFEVRGSKTSHSQISNASNTTVAVNYGSLSPGTQLTPVYFTYDIAKSMAGQKGWIEINLTENQRRIHSIVVDLEIQ